VRYQTDADGHYSAPGTALAEYCGGYSVFGREQLVFGAAYWLILSRFGVNLGVLLGAQVHVRRGGTCLHAVGADLRHRRSARPDSRQRDAGQRLWTNRSHAIPALGLILGSTLLTFCEFADLLLALTVTWVKVRTTTDDAH